MLTADLLPTSAETRQKVKLDTHDDILKMLSRYEAEIYQDRYLPEYQRTVREVSRREKEEAEAKRRRDMDALERVASFSGD